MCIRYTSKGSSMELTCDLLIIANSAKHYLNKPLKAKLPELDPGLNTYLLHAIDTLTVVACQQAAESTWRDGKLDRQYFVHVWLFWIDFCMATVADRCSFEDDLLHAAALMACWLNLNPGSASGLLSGDGGWCCWWSLRSWGLHLSYIAHKTKNITRSLKTLLCQGLQHLALLLVAVDGLIARASGATADAYTATCPAAIWNESLVS